MNVSVYEVLGNAFTDSFRGCMGDASIMAGLGDDYVNTRIRPLKGNESASVVANAAYDNCSAYIYISDIDAGTEERIPLIIDNELKFRLIVQMMLA